MRILLALLALVLSPAAAAGAQPVNVTVQRDGDAFTADFNFPLWNHFGRGSGQAGAIHRYPAEAALV